MEDLLFELRREFPEFRLVDKSTSRLMVAIDLFLKIVTFWRMKSFMRSFTTTIGYTVYVPSVWNLRPPKSRKIVLRHERVHMRQRRRWGWWYSLAYLFFPLPTLWAYCRMRFEMEAYAEGIRAIAEYYGPTAFTKEMKRRHVEHFTGPEYFWTWPWRKRIESWYDETVTKALLELGRSG